MTRPRDIIKTIRKAAETHGLEVTVTEGRNHTHLRLDGMLIPLPRQKHHPRDLQTSGREARKGLVAMSTYTVAVTPSEGVYALYIPEVDRPTQARHIREVDTMARDLVAIMTGEAPDSIDLDIQWPDSIGGAVHRWEDAARQMEAAQAARREAARELRAGGLPYRDVAHLLGVSYQRVQQLTA